MSDEPDHAFLITFAQAAKVWRACREHELARLVARAAEHYYLVCYRLPNQLHQNLVLERFCEKGNSSRIEYGLAP